MSQEAGLTHSLTPFLSPKTIQAKATAVRTNLVSLCSEKLLMSHFCAIALNGGVFFARLVPLQIREPDHLPGLRRTSEGQCIERMSNTYFGVIAIISDHHFRAEFVQSTCSPSAPQKERLVPVRRNLLWESFQ